MARLNGAAASEATALVGGVPKTIIQLVAPANQILALTGYGFGGRGISNTTTNCRPHTGQVSSAGDSSAPGISAFTSGSAIFSSNWPSAARHCERFSAAFGA